MTDAWLRHALETKRDGGDIDAATWGRIIEGYVGGTIDDAPVAALAMACAIRGMGTAEIIALTEAMVRSGETLDYALPARVVDKHSSGGVGDVVSLIVVPLVAACGVPVAKLSGRALGHTGGTLDKFEAIPSVRTDLSPQAFRAQIERVGCAIAAQSARLVPADKKLYTLRDQTGSVPSIGLIAASIVSKKIAAGADAIVYDVKCGSGAFMHRFEDARELAHVLVRLSTRFGRRATAIVSDMDEPLAGTIGTGLEAIEARDFLGGERPDARLAALVDVVAAEMLAVVGVAKQTIETVLTDALESGAAYEKFIEMIEAQGGARSSFEAMERDPRIVGVPATFGGFVTAIDAVALGEEARAIVAAHGSFAGIRVMARVGDEVQAGDRLAQIVGGADIARVAAAFTVGFAPPSARPLIAAIIRDADLVLASNGPSR